MDGIGGSDVVCHDAGDSGDSLFRAGHSHRTFQETYRRRPAQPSRGLVAVILEALLIETKRSSPLRKDVLGRHFQMSKAMVLIQLWQLMKRNKKYWLLPVIIVLVLIGALLVATQSSALAPFIYSLF